MPNPRRLAHVLLAGVLVAAAVVGVAASGGPSTAQAGVLGQTIIPITPCTSTSTQFAANLSSQQEVPPSGTGQSGTALLTLQPDGQSLVVTINTTLNPANVILAHIHSPAPPGVNAPVTVN